MQVREIMTENPSCCAPDANLQAVAKMMVECDCGEIPVVDQAGRPVGVVTDRDIACRAVARGKNPLQMQARDVMTTPVVTVQPDSSLEQCCKTMEENQVRRIPVVDKSGSCCGIVSQADIAQSAPETTTAQVLRDVSSTSAPRAAYH